VGEGLSWAAEGIGSKMLRRGLGDGESNTGGLLRGRVQVRWRRGDCGKGRQAAWVAEVVRARPRSEEFRVSRVTASNIPTSCYLHQTTHPTLLALPSTLLPPYPTVHLPARQPLCPSTPWLGHVPPQGLALCSATPLRCFLSGPHVSRRIRWYLGSYYTRASVRVRFFSFVPSRLSAERDSNDGSRHVAQHQK
jgi:hypothetical protein